MEQQEKIKQQINQNKALNEVEEVTMPTPLLLGLMETIDNICSKKNETLTNTGGVTNVRGGSQWDGD